MSGQALEASPRTRCFPATARRTRSLYRRLDPATLGMLVALYEHRVFVQAAIWDINAFDQWGVELGKSLANRLLPVIRDRSEPDGLDVSTAGLLARYRTFRGA